MELSSRQNLTVITVLNTYPSFKEGIKEAEDKALILRAQWGPYQGATRSGLVLPTEE